MNYEEKQEWLKTLKVGDKVYSYTSSNWYNDISYYSSNTVKTITKSGSIRLDNGRLIKIGCNTEIESLSDKIIEYNKNVKMKIALVEKMKSINIYELSASKVNRILEIVNEED